MKTLLIHSLIIVSMMVSAPALAQGDPLRVGMSGQYFPFTFVEQDTLKGFEVDVMNAIGKEMGREIQYQTANFSGLFGMLESGRIDTVANQITITEERQKAYIFSEQNHEDPTQCPCRPMKSKSFCAHPFPMPKSRSVAPTACICPRWSSMKAFAARTVCSSSAPFTRPSKAKWTAPMVSCTPLP